MKDNFSLQSAEYAKYRPHYPQEFFTYLNSIVLHKDNVWDCGTGSGQVAYQLSQTFSTVFATDISQSQIDNALQADNLLYSVQPAERTNFPEQIFDLVIVAQAIHWFDFERFYQEVRRTSKKHALICVLGYGKLEISEPIDRIITHFYENVIGQYWDKERRYVDESYKTIPFPFAEIETPTFVNLQHWTLQHLMGYLSTWSAVQHFIKQNAYNPLADIQSQLEQLWGDKEIKVVRFPLLLRLGQITK